jgi:hypothetical protein
MLVRERQQGKIQVHLGEDVAPLFYQFVVIILGINQFQGDDPLGVDSIVVERCRHRVGLSRIFCKRYDLLVTLEKILCTAEQRGNFVRSTTCDAYSPHTTQRIARPSFPP